LLIGTGVLASLACFVRMALRTGHDEWAFRPVWLVLLAGGTDGTGRSDGPDGGGGGNRPPRVPPRSGRSKRPCRERRRRPSRSLPVARRGA
jgi:hypothetical protein